MNIHCQTNLLQMLAALLLLVFAVASARAQKPVLEFESGHLETIRALAVSPDDKHLASAGSDRRIIVWDLAARKHLYSLRGHAEWIFTLAFSPNGKLLVSGSSDGVVKVWNVAEGNEEQQISLPLGNTFVAFSPDGSTLAIACHDASVRLWDVPTRKMKGELPGHTSPVSKVAFVDDKRLLSSGTDGPSGTGSDAVAAFKSGDLIAFSDGDDINLVNMATKQIRQLKGGYRNVWAVAFSPNGKSLFAHLSGELGIWGNRTGLRDKEAHSMMASLASKDNAFVSSANVLAHLERNEEGFADPKIVLMDVTGSNPPGYLEGHTKPVKAIAANPEGTHLASSSEDGTIKIWDVNNRVAIKTLDEDADALTYSPDGKLLAAETSAGDIKLWDVKTWTHRVIPVRARVRHLLFSPDSKVLATLGGAAFGVSELRTLTLWDVLTGQQLHSLVTDAKPRSRPGESLQGLVELFRDIVGYETAAGPMAFSKDSSLIACEGRDGSTGNHEIKIWKVQTGEEIHKLAGHYSSIPALDFSPNGRVLASGSRDKTVKFWNPHTGEELATLAPVSEEDWVIFTPDGRFDTNTSLDNVERMHWVMPGDALSPLSLDIFMRDYFEPKLLERILAGAALKPIRDISTLNRTQPLVAVREVKPDGAGTVEVTVEVANAVSGKQFDSRGRALESGVYDVRLFRDGQMVDNSTPEAALEAYVKTTGDLNPTAGFSEAELREWQKAHRVQLDRNGRATLLFRNVRLPQDGKTKEVVFSAYAFNNDRVKSSTARSTYALPPATGRPRKGRAYVVTVGVNLYENPDFNLSFAANDARQMQQALTSRLTATGQYEEVVPLSLISDSLRGADGAPKTQTDATKANIRAALRALAGKGGVSPSELSGILNAERLRTATPDDLVLILFAGHGFTGPKGDFYLVPYDMGEGVGKGVTAQLQQRSISSDEISLWLRDVDAGHLALIVDACHSASAVESAEFKPGPMGSRGLGQLAYDKGMLILTATQADNVAREGGRIKQGWLSHVLVSEGLEEMKADFEPADGAVTLREWLRYSVVGVPQLFDKIIAGEAPAFDRDVFVDDAGRLHNNQQQPSLFDFDRRADTVKLVSGPATAAPTKSRE